MLAVVAVLVTGSAFADPFTPSGGNLLVGTWEVEPFTFMNPGDAFPDVFDIPQGGFLLISGYYVTGDYYDVYDNGNLVLTTTQVTPTDIDYGDNFSEYLEPETAVGSGLFSTGEIKVKKGDEIQIVDLYPPSGIGEVGVEFVTPEPAAFVLMGTALLGFAMLRRRFSSVR
jgi:hypothetical protein